ncbi:hypothetical protein [Sphingosinicella sp. BN140058]|uniref:hypothetical protein n=1 Tax=Sphingosinicella sp. BN140058 TaxID=1892855 RepID=UPI001011CE93|nr:hypothetical protein [Sphingosinicella sp. BN140058]QAY80141.1 hypothetical protein ETR14_26220 [Sphingosinicella sp. BN140058]
MLDPAQRRQYGLGSMILAAVFVAVSAGAGVANAVRRDAVVEQVKTSDQECEARVRALGATSVSRTETTITAVWSSLEGGYSTLGDSSAAAMSCPGWKMTGFCMGQECPTPGVKLELGRVSSEEE